VKKFLLIIILATALNLSYQPSNSVPFEKHRISIAISTEDDLATAEAVREISDRRTAIRASIYMTVLLIDKGSCRKLDTS
jgi:hypothetical protein